MAHVRHPALLIVDLQEDFLNREGLAPPRSTLTAQAAELLEGCRELGVPVLHVHTRVRPDGTDRMSHWKLRDFWACVEGTPGVLPPAALRPRAGESVCPKRHYSAFSASTLEPALEALGAKTLLLAGVYLHACVRATALDACAKGYDVWIVEDAVGSTEPVHAEITRSYLAERSVGFLTTAELLARLGRKRAAPASPAARVPLACFGGRWREADESEARRWLRHFQPTRIDELVAEVPAARPEEVAQAAAAAAAAQVGWRRRETSERTALLGGFARQLSAQGDEIASLLTSEIGKPRAEAVAEIRRAVAHIETAVRVASEPLELDLSRRDGVSVRHRPVGTVGLITPWNNPVGIPVGKIAPALAFGNSVVWKPAQQAPRTAMRVLDCLLEAGLPADVVTLVFGDAETARGLIAAPAVVAVSVTGSLQTGRSAAALCAHFAKPLQAELGGNNAAIVLADCEVEELAPSLALAAFGFAGQRCTATRRWILERSIEDRFLAAFLAAVDELRVGDPAAITTQIGPLISSQQCGRVAAALELAVAEGGRILCGGSPPPDLDAGCYFAPTVVAGLPPRAHLVREETFGPVAVVLPAADLDEAIRFANDVEQGLVASVYGSDPAARARCAEALEAGILSFAPGMLAVHPEAPFGGWKASGIGPPEHGVWDREFYTRPQAVYGASPGSEV